MKDESEACLYSSFILSALPRLERRATNAPVARRHHVSNPLTFLILRRGRGRRAKESAFNSLCATRLF